MPRLQTMGFQNIIKTRLDGQTLLETMSVQDMLTAGLAPSPITSISWVHEGQAVSIRAAVGITNDLTHNRHALVTLMSSGPETSAPKLSVRGPNGSIKFEIPSIQSIHGHPEPGDFSWFEPPRSGNPGHFGVMFQRDRDQAMFQLDFDGETGLLMGVYQSR